MRNRPARALPPADKVDLAVVACYDPRLDELLLDDATGALEVVVRPGEIPAVGVTAPVTPSPPEPATKDYKQAAVLQVLLTALPEIARAIAEPLAKTDRITLVSTGGEGTGASRITGDIAKIMTELPAVVESLSGVDIRKLIDAIPALKAAAASGGEPAGPASKPPAR